MNTALAKPLLFKLLMLVFLFFASEAHSGDGCVSCQHITLRGLLQGRGRLHTEPGQPTLSNGAGSTAEAPVYKAKIGETYTVTFKPQAPPNASSPSPCGGYPSSLTLSTCNLSLFTPIADNMHTVTKELTFYGTYLAAVDAEACVGPPPEPPTDHNCSCGDCTGQQGCQCTGCYSAGTSEEIPYWDSYMQYGITTSTIDTTAENYEDLVYQATQHSDFIGFGAPGEQPLSVYYKDIANLTEVSYAEGDDFIRFYTWGETKYRTEIFGASECQCYLAHDDYSAALAAYQTALNQADDNIEETKTFIPWFPMNDKSHDDGEGTCSGPAEDLKGGASGPGDAATPPVASFSFGTGRDAQGSASSLLTMDCFLQHSDRVSARYVQLKDPFGKNQFSSVNPPPAGIKKRWMGNGLTVDVIQVQDNDPLVIRFKKGGEIIASHLFEKLSAISSLDPGVRYTKTRAGITQVYEYRGKSDMSGGASWYEKDPDGYVVEGVKSPFYFSTTGIPHFTRTETRRYNPDAVTDHVLGTETTTYAYLGMSPVPIETSVTLPGQQALTTQYVYYNTYDVNHYKLHYQINPDGSWIRYEYHPLNGELLRTHRPWKSGITNPTAANLQNAVTTTFMTGSLTYRPRPSYASMAFDYANFPHQWEVESIAGRVVRRTWNRKWISTPEDIPATALWTDPFRRSRHPSTYYLDLMQHFGVSSEPGLLSGGGRAILRVR
jgi:hypothetical protein